MGLSLRAHVITRTNDRVDGAPRPRSRPHAWAEDVALKNGALSGFDFGRSVPRLIPALNRAITRFGAGPVLIDRSYLGVRHTAARALQRDGVRAAALSTSSRPRGP